MRVKFHGVRGSIPTPLSNKQLQEKVESLTMRVLEDMSKGIIQSKKDLHGWLERADFSGIRTYGGNTPCIEVTAENGDRIILDAGSGIRSLGVELLGGDLGKGQGEAHILFSHFHYDHIQGLPFFIPVFIPGNTIHYYGGVPKVLKVIRDHFAAPYFPVEFDMLGASQVEHILTPGTEVTINGFTVSIHPLHHPNGSYAYRIERDKRCLIYATDSEFLDREEAEYDQYKEFFRNADCLVVDTQFSILEAMTHKKGWGHSPYNIDIDLAVAAGVKKLMFFHYDPMMSDPEIAKTQEEAMEYRKLLYPLSNLDLQLSWEGLELHL